MDSALAGKKKRKSSTRTDWCETTAGISAFRLRKTTKKQIRRNIRQGHPIDLTIILSLFWKRLIVWWISLDSDENESTISRQSDMMDRFNRNAIWEFWNILWCIFSMKFSSFWSFSGDVVQHRIVKCDVLKFGVRTIEFSFWEFFWRKFSPKHTCCDWGLSLSQ